MTPAPAGPADRAMERVTIAAALLLVVLAWTWTSDAGYTFDRGNQLVHLVELQRALDPEFLARDWFLNAGGEGVRAAYLGTLALLSRVAGIPAAVLLLWIAQVALLATAGYQLGLALHERRAAGYLGAILCVLVPGPALADHWLVRSQLNPAPLSKALAILALAWWLTGKRAAVLALIAATLVHVQVGLQAAGLIAVGSVARAAWRWRHGAALPRPAGPVLAVAAYVAVAVGATWPVLRSGPPLDAEFLELVVARFRFPWHFVPSCQDPAEVAAFVSLGLSGLLAFRLAGLGRSRWPVALGLAGCAAIGVALAALGRVPPAWQEVWPELTLSVGLTALAEGLRAARIPSESGDAVQAERGAAVTAIGAVLVAGLVAGVLFVEVLPLGLAVELRLLRLSVFLKALALVLIAGPLARALLRGPVAEALAAAVATVALLGGRSLPALLALAGLAIAPAFSPRHARIALLTATALAALHLGGVGGVDGRRLVVAAAVLVMAAIGRAGWLDAGPARGRRLAVTALALAGTAAAIVVTAPGLAGREGLPPPSDLDRLAAWARAHTERDGVFLVPLHAFAWRRAAERAVVVEMGAVPFGRTAIREWVQRVADVAGYPGRDPRTFLRELNAPPCAWPFRQLGRGYAARGPTELRALAARYGARYVVRDGAAPPLPWPALHQEGAATLYAVPTG